MELRSAPILARFCAGCYYGGSFVGCEDSETSNYGTLEP